MYKIEFTHQYLKDIKLARKPHLDESKLNYITNYYLRGNLFLVKIRIMH